MLRGSITPLQTAGLLTITEVDRLGRNKKDTVEELLLLADRNVRVMILETVNNMLIELYATMAQKLRKRKKDREKALKQRNCVEIGAIMADRK